MHIGAVVGMQQDLVHSLERSLSDLWPAVQRKLQQDGERSLWGQLQVRLPVVSVLSKQKRLENANGRSDDWCVALRDRRRELCEDLREVLAQKLCWRLHSHNVQKIETGRSFRCSF